MFEAIRVFVKVHASCIALCFCVCATMFVCMLVHMMSPSLFLRVANTTPTKLCALLSPTTADRGAPFSLSDPQRNLPTVEKNLRIPSFRRLVYDKLLVQDLCPTEIGRNIFGRPIYIYLCTLHPIYYRKNVFLIS